MFFKRGNWSINNPVLYSGLLRLLEMGHNFKYLSADAFNGFFISKYLCCQ